MSKQRLPSTAGGWSILPSVRPPEGSEVTSSIPVKAWLAAAGTVGKPAAPYLTFIEVGVLAMGAADIRCITVGFWLSGQHRQRVGSNHSPQ